MQGNGKRTNAPLFSRWSSGLLHTCRERKGKRMHRRWMSLAVVAVALLAGAGSATATPSGVGAFGAGSAAGNFVGLGSMGPAGATQSFAANRAAPRQPTL